MSVAPLKNKKLGLVKLGENALKIASHCDLTNDIITVLNAMNGLNQLKNSNVPELVKRACELAENADYSTTNEKLKLDKKQIVFDALFDIFPELNNDKDKTNIGQIIDFCCTHGLIKKIAQTTIVAKKVSKIVARRFF